VYFQGDQGQTESILKGWRDISYPADIVHFRIGENWYGVTMAYAGGSIE